MTIKCEINAGIFGLVISIARKDAVEQYHSIFCPTGFGMIKKRKGLDIHRVVN